MLTPERLEGARGTWLSQSESISVAQHLTPTRQRMVLQACDEWLERCLPSLVTSVSPADTLRALEAVVAQRRWDAMTKTGN